MGADMTDSLQGTIDRDLDGVRSATCWTITDQEKAVSKF
jgi:hypothetical protein